MSLKWPFLLTLSKESLIIFRDDAMKERFPDKEYIAEIDRLLKEHKK